MSDAVEIALLARLLQTGEIKESVRTSRLIERFEAAMWVTMSERRASTWVVRDAALPKIRQRLENLLPTWQADFEYLRGISRNPLNPSDIEALPMLRRQVPPGAQMVNRRNWNAAVGLGPKNKAKLPASVALTKDWVLRFRANRGLVGHTDYGPIGLDAEVGRGNEFITSERAWQRITSIGGRLPEIAISCENLGAYIDLPVDSSVLVVFAPGADIEPASTLLGMLPTIRWIHFGDLDPVGITIGKSLAAKLARPLELFIPTFAGEYLGAARSPKKQWGDIPDISILKTLKDRKHGLFQEVFMLDGRLAGEIIAIKSL